MAISLATGQNFLGLYTVRERVPVLTIRRRTPSTPYRRKSPRSHGRAGSGGTPLTSGEYLDPEGEPVPDVVELSLGPIITYNRDACHYFAAVEIGETGP